VEDFCDPDNSEHRHQVYFPDTRVPGGFNRVLNEQIEPMNAWQFEVAPKSNWRAHGFLIDDTFYLVWLDPHHKLYANGTA
jgi:hypothetical protein